jgi:hypothetical protein
VTVGLFMRRSNEAVWSVFAVRSRRRWVSARREVSARCDVSARRDCRVQLIAVVSCGVERGVGSCVFLDGRRRRCGGGRAAGVRFW